MKCPLCGRHHDGHERSPGAISDICEQCADVASVAGVDIHGYPKTTTASPAVAKKVGVRKLKQATKGSDVK